MHQSFSNHVSRLLVCMGFAYLLLCPVDAYSQTEDKEPEHELAMGLNVVTGAIQYGSNKFYITDKSSASIGPMFRYDHPVKLSSKRNVRRYIYWTAQAGFLFGKGKVFDSTYFDPSDPSYMPLSIGIYNASALSLGAEIFFWKGLGTRDIWGIKFISIGYNAGKFRVNASAQRYMQVIKTRHRGTVFAFDFLWKLIK